MQEDMQERQQRADRIEELLQEVSEFSDPRARAVTEELIQSLLDMYGEGLDRVLELTVQTETKGYELVKAFMQDELLGSLFILHDLYPVDLETRIVQALDEVRPYLKSHGGNVELVSVADGVARLRLEGSCHGCPSSTMTLKLTIEEAIYKAAPDLESLLVDGVSEPPRQPGKAGTPVTFIPPKRKKDAPDTGTREQSGGWKAVDGLETLSTGTLKAINVAQEPLIFCQIEGTYYAYYNRCSSCQKPLKDSRLDGTTLICSSCGRQYDIYHAGRSVDASNFFLEPIPLLHEEGKIRVMLPTMTGDKAALSAIMGER